VYGRALVADVENGYTAWSASDIATGAWVASAGTASIDAEKGLKVAQQRGSAKATNTDQMAITENAIVTIDAVWNTGYASGGSGENNAFTIGNNIEVRAYTYDQKGCVYINGSEYAAISNACGKNNGNRENDPWTIHIVINTATNKITAFTILGANGTNKATYTLDGEISLASGTTYNSLSLAHNRTKGNNAAEACYLTSILVKEEAQVVATADYTINYNFEGATIKSESGSSIVGATISATLPLTVADQKYYAADGATTSINLVAGDNELNVDLRKAYEYAYSISNNFGTSIAAGTYIEGESPISVSWSKYVKNGEKWYECDESSYSLSVSGALTKTITYTTEADIAYFFECEGLTVSRSPAASDTWSAWSGGKAVRHYSSSYWYTDALAGGVYNLSVPYKNNNSSATTINLYLRDSEGALTDTGLSIEGAKQSSGTLSAEGIEIPEGYSLVLNNTTAYNSNVLMDYVALTLVRPLTVAPAVTDYATFSSPYALNFATATGVQAYVAKSSDGSVVTMEKVTGAVPANTGLLLQKMKDEVSIPVVAEGVAPAANLLKPGTGAAVKSEGATMRYVLAGTGEATSFYCLAEANAAVVIPEGKAYLEVVGAPARLAIVFEDSETTGIATVENANVLNENYYNLNGQRIVAPQKGLYIVNGKKVVLK